MSVTQVLISTPKRLLYLLSMVHVQVQSRVEQTQYPVTILQGHTTALVKLDLKTGKFQLGVQTRMNV